MKPRRRTPARPAASNNWADGKGDSANRPSARTVFRRRFSSALPAAARLLRVLPGRCRPKYRNACARRYRPEAAAMAPTSTIPDTGRSLLKSYRTHFYNDECDHSQPAAGSTPARRILRTNTHKSEHKRNRRSFTIHSVFVAGSDCFRHHPVRHMPRPSGSSAERRIEERGDIAFSAAIRFSVAGWVENRSETPVGTM